MAYPHDNQASREGGEVKEECAVNDIAGLLALMQSNKGMDLPGLLALCKEKGYDKSWGGEGMFMFVFLILFLFAGGGFGNLGNRFGPNAQADFAAAAGMNLQDIIGLYDRLAANQTATQQGFQSLDTKLCSAISETIAAVRNQGDRTYDATRNVGDAVRDCCCTMQAKLAELGCKVDGLYGHTSLVGERLQNAMERQFCATNANIDNLRAEMNLGFERTQCLITNTAAQQEKERLQREVEELKDKVNGSAIADVAVAKILAALPKTAANS